MTAAVVHESLSQAHQCRLLAEVLTITKQMLSCAENNEWSEVTKLEQRRRDGLAVCFSQTSGLPDSVLVAEAVAALLHLNEELMSRLKVAREQVMVQGLEYTRNRKAMGNYHEVGNNR
jgi:hypothetical protein